MVAFAANSLFCRIALAGGLLDAPSFATLRIASGALLLLWLVRAHDRRMNVRARHYHRDTLTERHGDVRLRLLRALRIAYMTGRTPRLGEVGAA